MEKKYYTLEWNYVEEENLQELMDGLVKTFGFNAVLNCLDDDDELITSEQSYTVTVDASQPTVTWAPEVEDRTISCSAPIIEKLNALPTELEYIKKEAEEWAEKE